MKTAYFVIIILLPAFCLAQKTKKNNWEKHGLKDKVKVIKYCSKTKNNKDEVTGFTFSADNYWIDTFSNTGLELLQYRIEGEKVATTITYKYDIKGNQIEETNYNNEKKELFSRRTRDYDANGNDIEHRLYDKDGNVTAWVKYIYADGALTEQDDSMVYLGFSTMKFTNDANGRATEAERTNDRDVTITKYQYDERGNKTEAASYDKNGGLKYRTTWKYDEHNNEILQEQYDQDNKQTASHETEYTYDSHGNWIRKLSNLGVLYSVQLREINYY